MIVKKSSIRTDMANRAMYGALSAIFPNDIVKDTIIIDKTVQGAKDLVTYGTLACVEEVRGYKEFFNKYVEEELGVTIDEAVNDLKEIKFSYDSYTLYEEYLDVIIKMFLDKDWLKTGPSMGGKLWAKIATALKNIIVLYQKYEELDNRDYENKIKVGNQIIYTMNIFDNLAHNTGSIFDHICEEEDKNNRGHDLADFTDEDIDENLEERYKILELMNSKNLKNPYEALISAEKNLESTLPFNEKYLQKIRSTKEYAEAKRKDIDKDVRLIADVKESISNIYWIIGILEYLKKNIRELSANKNSSLNSKIKSTLKDFKNAIESSLDMFDENNNEYFKTIKEKCRKYLESISSLLEDIDEVERSIDSDYYSEEDEAREDEISDIEYEDREEKMFGLLESFYKEALALLQNKNAESFINDLISGLEVLTQDIQK